MKLKRMIKKTIKIKKAEKIKLINLNKNQKTIRKN